MPQLMETKTEAEERAAAKAKMTAAERADIEKFEAFVDRMRKENEASAAKIAAAAAEKMENRDMNVRIVAMAYGAQNDQLCIDAGYSPKKDEIAIQQLFNLSLGMAIPTSKWMPATFATRSVLFAQIMLTERLDSSSAGACSEELIAQTIRPEEKANLTRLVTALGVKQVSDCLGDLRKFINDDHTKHTPDGYTPEQALALFEHCQLMALLVAKTIGTIAKENMSTITINTLRQTEAQRLREEAKSLSPVKTPVSWTWNRIGVLKNKWRTPAQPVQTIVVKPWPVARTEMMSRVDTTGLHGEISRASTLSRIVALGAKQK